ncbi:phosphate ABC transporter substrate-binding protein PstS family protein [Lactobacillus sp. YT155]|uniref:phosphate ABC transporter substrate-binding protein PstS family protein n=1 Tax=Lactobacillus sp. YT155 TaxID=3060955 RepID=UPI00265EAA24|nr:phosphate ABC transporter substrate-binding protein PstS family protein [Lactobacillus sp. YT155]MDO1605123.1 phosphate ABC transporter substrate-binding protein PstS family protein [Lactobacillus sp. YT155]
MKKIGLLILSLITVLILTGCGQTKEKTITVVGSSAVQPLAESASEIYSEQNKGVYINVQGGGTGTGLSQIQSGAVDIGNSDLFAQEKKGIDAKQLVDYKICVVGIVPVVNKDLKIKNLTLTQLRKIFAGQITNWQDVGGPNLPITIINRASGSGTRSVFEKSVMNNLETKKSQEQDSSGMVRQIIANTPGSISYLAMPYINSDVKTLKVDGHEATKQNIVDNKWTIWSYEHMYIQKNGDPLAKEFIDFILSKHVQKNVVEKMRYIPISEMNYQKDDHGKTTKIGGK